jgi:hypothetical protein
MRGGIVKVLLVGTLAWGSPALAQEAEEGPKEASSKPEPPPEDGQATPQPADVAPPKEEPALVSFLRKTRLQATVDTYYDYNTNQPPSGQNALRNFDIEDNQFSFSYLEVAFEQKPTADSRVGFRVDAGIGPTTDTVHFLNEDEEKLKYLQQGYASYLAPLGSGLQIDVGKFVTPAGAEVIETKDNWNYSRSLLFAWTIPYYHVGLRTAYTVNDRLAVTGYVVNGWNNAFDTNDGKTLGAQVSVKPLAPLTLTQTWLGGPEGPDGQDAWRHVFDTIATWTVTPKLSVMANFDYGRDRVDDQRVEWTGVALYGRYQVLPQWAVSPRVEWFEDADGFSTGTAQTLREVTFTSEHALFGGLSARLEYRRDRSNVPFFEEEGGDLKRSQQTFLVGFVYGFNIDAQ